MKDLLGFLICVFVSTGHAAVYVTVPNLCQQFIFPTETLKNVQLAGRRDTASL